MIVSLSLVRPPVIMAMGIPRHGEAQAVDDYLLPDHWCFHVYSYEATLELDGFPHRVRPGTASLIPPGTRMVYRYQGPSEHVYFHFQVRSEGEAVQTTLVKDLGSRFVELDSRARSAVARQIPSDGFSTAALWSMLWEYVALGAEAGSSTDGSRHPLVAMTMNHIEQRLALPLTVAGLSLEVGVTPGYLTRLFASDLGMPLSDYIRARRADQAAYLLASTTLPIKVISRMVGLTRVTQFNRLMHELKGAGPRELRKSGGTHSRGREH
ncbi:MAG: AraC family transcriptional regulator [Armatimonadota bacterium]